MAKFVEGKNRVWRLRSRPEGTIKDTDLELCIEDIPSIGDGQMLVKNTFISVDPTHRIWMSDKAQYMDCVALNDIMRAATLGEVVESKVEEYPVGTAVHGFGGLADYYVGIPNVTVQWKVGGTPLPLQADLSVASPIIGLAAWKGMKIILAPGPDDIVVVSGAAGAVGSLAGQLAKAYGDSKIIGIAGGAAKCALLKDEFGFDVAIDYKAEDVGEALKKHAPDGITRYFDNVGGSITDAVLANMRNFGKIALCGSISEYDDNWAGWKNANMILMRRLTVTGFICLDNMGEEWADCKAGIVKLASEGKIKYKEDIREGLETYIDTVRSLYTGKNDGKLMIKV